MNFDQESAIWDQQPRRVKLAEDVASAILEEVEFSSDADVLDFGCGTGLVTLRLQPLVGSITGADTSRGMLGVLDAKVRDRRLENVRTLLLSDGAQEVAGPYHVIVSSMALHHVKDARHLLVQLGHAVVPNGQIVVADLDPEGGRFHEDAEGVHHCGFDRGALRGWLTEAGFSDLRERTAATVVKQVAGGDEEAFSVFLVVGRKEISECGREA